MLFINTAVLLAPRTIVIKHACLPFIDMFPVTTFRGSVCIISCTQLFDFYGLLIFNSGLFDFFGFSFNLNGFLCTIDGIRFDIFRESFP